MFATAVADVESLDLFFVGVAVEALTGKKRNDTKLLRLWDTLGVDADLEMLPSAGEGEPDDSTIIFEYASDKRWRRDPITILYYHVELSKMLNTKIIKFDENVIDFLATVPYLEQPHKVQSQTIVILVLAENTLEKQIVKLEV